MGVFIGLCLFLFAVAFYFNWNYEIIAFNPFWKDGQHEFKVMTWNVHCSKGADCQRQKEIAELILKEDADFVQLNEYYQDSCSVTDSLLRAKYPYTEESQSHWYCGDIFYSKKGMSNSGIVYDPIQEKSLQTIKATIGVGGDYVQIFGVHMASNNYNDYTMKEELKKVTSSYNRYKYAQKNRNSQAYWTKEAVLESKLPVIVMGDMNDFNCSAPLDTFTCNGMRDSWWEGGNGYGHTYHDGWIRLRIDHILHSKKLKLESIKVIDTNLSDHNPVVAGFSVVRK